MIEEAELHRTINPARRRHLSGVAGAKTIVDLQLLARRRLPNFVYEYIEGGADAELTLRRNATVFETFRWLPKLAIDTASVDTAVSLFGASAAMPVVIAPMGLSGMSWARGDRLIAEAAASAGIPATQSTASMLAIEDVASVPGVRHWFQLYPYGDERVVERLLARALDAGSETLVVTVDGAVAGNRIWDQRNFQSPGRLGFRSKLECLLHPAWLWSVLLRDGPPNFVNLVEFVGSPDPDVFTVGRWIAANRPQLSWERIRRIREMWPRTLVVKGILRVDEAQAARAMGADGIVLSNHGGRQVDSAVSPIEVLPGVRSALGPDYPILVDSGYRTGGQIATALALGATAVMIGRPALYGLAAGGQNGVKRALSILRTELERTMALIGARRISELEAHYLSQ